MSLTTPVRVAPDINLGLTSARQLTMLTLLGQPRPTYNQHCQPVTYARLKTMIVARDLGPFRVNGLRPAVDSLVRIIADIKTARPLVHQALGTVGMLCARNQRGSTTAISNHSWGTAIDLTLKKRRPRRARRRQGAIGAGRHLPDLQPASMALGCRVRDRGRHALRV